MRRLPLRQRNPCGSHGIVSGRAVAYTSPLVDTRDVLEATEIQQRPRGTRRVHAGVLPLGPLQLQTRRGPRGRQPRLAEMSATIRRWQTIAVQLFDQPEAPPTFFAWRSRRHRLGRQLRPRCVGWRQVPRMWRNGSSIPSLCALGVTPRDSAPTLVSSWAQRARSDASVTEPGRLGGRSSMGISGCGPGDRCRP